MLAQAQRAFHEKACTDNMGEGTRSKLAASLMRSSGPSDATGTTDDDDSAASPGSGRGSRRRGRRLVRGRLRGRLRLLIRRRFGERLGPLVGWLLDR